MSHISVMIPVYNRENLIIETIQSVLSQTYTDLDLTIIDDASTDNTTEIINKFCKDSRITLIKNEENLGLTKNWNHCLEVAKRTSSANYAIR